MIAECLGSLRRNRHVSLIRCAARRLGFKAFDILLFVEVVVLEFRLIDWIQLFVWTECFVDIRVVEVVLCASRHEDWLHCACLESLPVEALEPSVLLQFVHAARSDSLAWIRLHAFVSKVCSFHGPAANSRQLYLQDLGLE